MVELTLKPSSFTPGSDLGASLVLGAMQNTGCSCSCCTDTQRFSDFSRIELELGIVGERRREIEGKWD